MALAGKIALVTGGASGLGKACVLRFVKQGARVAIVDLPSQPGGLVAGQLGSNAIFTPADVSSEEQVSKRAGRAASGMGALEREQTWRAATSTLSRLQRMRR